MRLHGGNKQSGGGSGVQVHYGQTVWEPGAAEAGTNESPPGPCLNVGSWRLIITGR